MGGMPEWFIYARKRGEVSWKIVGCVTPFYDDCGHGVHGISGWGWHVYATNPIGVPPCFTPKTQQVPTAEDAQRWAQWYIQEHCQ